MSIIIVCMIALPVISIVTSVSERLSQRRTEHHTHRFVNGQLRRI